MKPAVHEDVISEAEAQAIDAWQPEGIEDSPRGEPAARESDTRRLLLCLEIAVRDCREAATRVQQLLPAMTAVADRIDSASSATHRLVVATCVGVAVGFLVCLELTKVGWL